MKRASLILICIIAIAASLLLSGQLYLNYEVRRKMSGDEANVIFEIPRGMKAREIAKKLEEEKFISNDLYFLIYIWENDLISKMQAGSYELNRRMSVCDIAQVLSAGKVKNEVKITFPEGWTREQMAKYLERQKLGSADNFLKATEKIDAFDFSFIKELPQDATAEGFLFPDTYLVYKDAKPRDIIEKMLYNFDKKLTQELREEIKKQDKSLYEIVIMASIIEREANKDPDRKIVSDILWERLIRGVPLQADATIRYITGDWTSPITKLDLDIDSPYNTRKFQGLPPAPISNPGMDSILAAIYPEKTEYFYYLTTPEGETLFFKTLSEHEEAKAKYLK